MITAQIASLPERENSLKLTIDSLINQVDHLFVALNNYDHIPEFVRHSKISFELMDNSTGDASKFYGIELMQGFFFSCDDDLIYPDTYVKDMIRGVNKYKCIVTLHGRSFLIKPILSYYQSATHKYRCLDKVNYDVQVDVGGTGVMAFHTDMVKVKYSDFKAPNMADIWMSKIAHDQNVPIMVLAHDKGYLLYTPPKNTIYDNCSKDCEYQTTLINTIL